MTAILIHNFLAALCHLILLLGQDVLGPLPPPTTGGTQHSWLSTLWLCVWCACPLLLWVPIYMISQHLYISSCQPIWSASSCQPMGTDPYPHITVFLFTWNMTALSKVNMQHTSLSYFSKYPPMDIFLVSLCISLPTHTLQRMYKDNNSKITATTTHLWRWPFHHAAPTRSSYHLNYFFILFKHNWLSHMHTSKLQYNISFKKTHRAILCNSLRKLKASQDQHLGPKILVTNPMTLVIPAIHFAWIPYDYTPVIWSTGSYLKELGDFTKVQ